MIALTKASRIQCALFASGIEEAFDFVVLSQF
jgi:hypothetical protein